MIEKDCDYWKGLSWLKKIVIKKIHACGKINFSSNVNEVIRSVLNSSFFFLRKDFARTKSTKNTKNTKSTKSTKTQPSKNTKRCKQTKKNASKNI